MRRLERGAGRRRDRRTGPSTSAAGARQLRASDWRGARGRAARTARTRAASGLRPGTQRSPARSWLTGANAEKARPDAVRRTPQQSAEKRAGLRHWPVIFGRFPKIGPLARRTTGCGASAPAPVGALLPSFFWGADKGAPPPPQRAGGALASRLSFRGRAKLGARNP
jgi:hypothetical protein